MFRIVVLADPVGIVDLEDHEIVRVQAGRVAERKRMGGDRLVGDVAPEIDDGEPARGESTLHLRRVEQRFAVGKQGAVGVVAGRRPGQIAQPLRRAGQGVVTMHHVQRRLDLLPAFDMAPAPVAGDRADVVVEGRDEARAACLRNDLLAVRVVAAHDLVVVEKVDVGTGHQAVEPFEAVGPERQALGRRQTARVVNRHPAPFP